MSVCALYNKADEFTSTLGDRQYDFPSHQSQPAQNPLCGWRNSQTADLHAQKDFIT
jgi:hypothetical protein